MATASWNGTVIAQSDHAIQFDGNVYFPPEALKKEFFKESSETSVCPWKGTAQYYDVVVKGQTNTGACWYYPTPLEQAQEIKGYAAFWKGVTVQP